MFVLVCVCASMCVCMWIYVCRYMYVCVYVCKSVYVCVCVCVCMYTHMSTWATREKEGRTCFMSPVNNQKIKLHISPPSIIFDHCFVAVISEHKQFSSESSSQILLSFFYSLITCSPALWSSLTVWIIMWFHGIFFEWHWLGPKVSWKIIYDEQLGKTVVH